MTEQNKKIESVEVLRQDEAGYGPYNIAEMHKVIANTVVNNYKDS